MFDPWAFLNATVRAKQNGPAPRGSTGGAGIGPLRSWFYQKHQPQTKNATARTLAAGRDAGPILIFDITSGGCRGPLLAFASGIRASEYEADAQKTQLPAQPSIMSGFQGKP
jgi:hypothetical protein